jgi:hypothetical protein
MAGTIPMICPKELLRPPSSEKGKDQQDQDDKVDELDVVAQWLLSYFGLPLDVERTGHVQKLVLTCILSFRTDRTYGRGLPAEHRTICFTKAGNGSSIR